MSFTIYDKDNPNRYDEIINFPTPESKTRPHLSLPDRAAQFASFKALSGYEDMVVETARLTDMELELSDEMKDELDLKLSIANDLIKAGEKPEITITYFVPDEYKNGGSYKTVTGKVKRIDCINREIIFLDKNECSNGITISVDYVLNIASEDINTFFEKS